MPSAKGYLRDFLRVWDVHDWVTERRDTRHVVAGVIALALLLVTFVYLAIAFNTEMYNVTAASCTCQSLDDVQVDPGTFTISNFPKVYTRKVCEGHEVGTLCDRGSFACNCNADGSCDEEGMVCNDGVCGVQCDADGNCPKPAADWLLKGNSFAVQVCRTETARRLAGIARLIGAGAQFDESVADNDLFFTADQLLEFRRHARCVVGWNACQTPDTLVARLNIIGSTWGWCTLFIIPAIMAINCFAKVRFHGLGAVGRTDKYAADQQQTELDQVTGPGAAADQATTTSKEAHYADPPKKMAAIDTGSVGAAEADADAAGSSDKKSSAAVAARKSPRTPRKNRDAAAAAASAESLGGVRRKSSRRKKKPSMKEEEIVKEETATTPTTAEEEAAAAAATTTTNEEAAAPGGGEDGADDPKEE